MAERNQQLTKTDAQRAPAQRRTMFESVGSVLAGVVIVIVLSLGTDGLMHATGIFPPVGESMRDSQFALATAYRSIYAVAGSYVAARIAPLQPEYHSLAVGLIGFLLGVVGTIATWNQGAEYGRKWYPVTVTLLAVPCAWLGAKLNSWLEK